MLNTITAPGMHCVNFSGAAQKNISRYIEAPPQTSRFCINDALNEKRSFRKQAVNSFIQAEKSKKRMSFIKKILAGAAFIGTLFVLDKKNII